MLLQALQQHSPQHVTRLGPHANWPLCHHQRPCQSTVDLPSIPRVYPSGHHSTASSRQVLGCFQAAAASVWLDAALEANPKFRPESTPESPVHEKARISSKGSKADIVDGSMVLTWRMEVSSAAGNGTMLPVMSYIHL